jgi:hypothetical protein
MALRLKGPERGRRIEACTTYIGESSLDDRSAQVFPYNIHQVVDLDQLPF